MTTNRLGKAFPLIASALPVAGLTEAPTPLSRHAIEIGGAKASAWIKHDEHSGSLYGGNKVRKLDYILARALARRVDAVATFGAVGSHHALATALYTRSLGLEPICFLGHQASTDHVYEALSAHVANETRIVRYGGDRARRIATLRNTLAAQRTWVVPAGGSSWLGVVGFVDAALELVEQLAAPGNGCPGQLYVANGTMGTVAGLALGLALTEPDIEVQAVRVTSEAFANRQATYRLMRKTATLLNRIDPAFPADLADGARVRFRHEFVGDGYTRPTPASDAALRYAGEELGLALETTYTAKAFAALMADVEQRATGGRSVLFWNTYSAVELPRAETVTLEDTGLPGDFERYFP